MIVDYWQIKIKVKNLQSQKKEKSHILKFIPIGKLNLR